MIRIIFPSRSTIIVTLLAIVFSLSLIGLSIAKAQTPLSTQSPQPLTGNETTKAQQQTQFSNYTDPHGRFSMKYPSTWTVEPAANKFETVHVSFKSPPQLSLADLDITAPSTHETDPEVYTITVSAQPQPGYSMFQGPECVKYKIDGQKACSYIMTTVGSSGGRLVIMHVNSFVDGQMYSFTFSGHGDTFDKDLPLVEQMLASFRAPP
jgi:hypothetical protein